MNKIKILISVISAVVLFSIIIGICVTGIDSPYDKQIKLAHKFIDDGNYEEAIIAFNKAIYIDEKRVEAYLGLADVYVKQDDYDKAVEILEKGFLLTENSELEKKILELKAANQSVSDSKILPQETAKVGKLSISDFTYQYENGELFDGNNKNSVGGMRINATVNGPDNVSGVLIGTWKMDTPFTEDEIQKNIARLINTWKESGSMKRYNEVPFSISQYHPVKAKDIGKKAYVLLIGFNAQEEAVGYAVVEEIIGQ